MKIESRRGVAGILAGVILFAAIFTTGFGLLLYMNANTQTANHANVQRENNGLQSASEKLLVTANVTKQPALWVNVVNTGGVPTTIVDIYVTCQSSCSSPSQEGQLISNSIANPPSHFLSESPKDLNVSLPYSLGVGASKNINITALDWATQPSERVVVSLLTSAGSVFSAQYPPPPLTNTTNVIVQEESTEVLLNQVAGGPQLSVMLTASALCPDGTAGCTQTFSCSDGCVTVTATVFNLASSEATGVSFSLGTPSVGGTASVEPYSSPLCAFSGGATTADIPPDSSATATCQFSASTGATGGLASFSGTASGSVGFPVASANSVSNSIEIGGLSSVTTQGAFVANFFFLKYSSCFQNTGGNFAGSCQTNANPVALSNLPEAGTTAAGANFYVAFYVQVTNVLNSRLPILQYSYIYGDPASSADNFIFLVGTNGTMVDGVYYPTYHPASGNPTLQGYPTDCSTVNANNMPTDPNCIYADPGQTVDLTFAACGYGASSWAWGSHQDAQKFDTGSSGCTGNPPDLIAPEAMPLGVVVSYLFNGQIYTQVMPFQAMQFIRSSSAMVSCSPSGVTAGTQATCTATVLDTDGFPKVFAPEGTVTFSGPAVGEGTFNSTSCTIFFGSCAVTYTPSLATQGKVSMTVTYQGDNTFAGSSNTTSITALDPTTTTIMGLPGSCGGAIVLDNTPTTCTVTVTDVTGGFPSSPTGTITMSDNPSGSGTFGTCHLAPSGSATASCTVTYTPKTGAGGPITITATYGGDASHGGSSGSTGLTAKATPTITTSLSSSTIPIGGSATDTATLSGAYQPTGSVTFTVYSNSGCTVQVFSSANAISGSTATSGSFTPTSLGTYYWKASYPGDTYNTAYTTTCGPSGETLTVSKASPTISTTVSSGGNILTGSSASDSGTFSGGYGTLTGNLVFEAFTSSACTGSPSYTSSTIPVNGNGPYSSGSYAPSSAGTYYWQATFTDTDGYNNGFMSACGGSGETLTVTSPTLTLSPTQGPPGITTTLTGSSYADSSGYSDCLSTASGSVSCVLGSTSSFTSSRHGAIPSGTTVTVPPGTAAGTYYVIVYTGSSVITSASFTVTTPMITLSITKAAAGTTGVSVTGSGFTPSTSIGSFTFNGATPNTQTCTSKTTSATGTFSCTFTVPSDPPEMYAVIATGSDSPADTASAEFTIPGVVQSNSNTCTSTTCTVSFNNAVTEGDELVLAIGTRTTSTTCATVSGSVKDSAGTYSTATLGESSSGTSDCAYTVVYYLSDTSYSGTDTITVKLSGSPSSAVLEVYELAGVAATPTAQVGKGTTSTSMATSSLPTTANAVLIAVGEISHSSGSTYYISAGTSGFTASYDPKTAANPEWVEYQYPASTGSTTFGMTISGTVNSWSETGVEFAYDASPSTSVACTAASVEVGSMIQCTATVTGYSGSLAGETVTWTQGGSGTVTFSPVACTLSAAGTCTVIVQASSEGGVTIHSTYSGDEENSASVGAFSLTVTPGAAALSNVVFQTIMLPEEA